LWNEEQRTKNKERSRHGGGDGPQGNWIYIWLTAVGSGGTTLGGELCRFLDLVGHGAKFDQTESCGSSVERGPG